LRGCHGKNKVRSKPYVEVTSSVLVAQRDRKEPKGHDRGERFAKGNHRERGKPRNTRSNAKPSLAKQGRAKKS